MVGAYDGRHRLLRRAGTRGRRAAGRACDWDRAGRDPVAQATGQPVIGIIAARLDGEHQQEPVPHTIRYSVGDNRIDIVRDDGATSSLWWATRNEWLGLVDVAGLELEALYGGFAREPLGDESREYVFVTRRPTTRSSANLQRQ